MADPPKRREQPGRSFVQDRSNAGELQCLHIHHTVKASRGEPLARHLDPGVFQRILDVGGQVITLSPATGPELPSFSRHRRQPDFVATLMAITARGTQGRRLRRAHRRPIGCTRERRSVKTLTNRLDFYMLEDTSVFLWIHQRRGEK
jgi:hypothetical protein